MKFDPIRGYDPNDIAWLMVYLADPLVSGYGRMLLQVHDMLHSMWRCIMLSELH